MPVAIRENFNVAGRLVLGELVCKTVFVSDAIADIAHPWNHDKRDHELRPMFGTGVETTVTASKQTLHLAAAAGTIIEVIAACHTAPTDGVSDDYQVTIDVKKNGTSVLTGATPITIDKTIAAGTLVEGAVDPAQAAYVANDRITVEVAVPGSVGTQAAGLYGHVQLFEAPAP